MVDAQVSGVYPFAVKFQDEQAAVLEVVRILRGDPPGILPPWTLRVDGDDEAARDAREFLRRMAEAADAEAASEK